MLLTLVWFDYRSNRGVEDATYTLLHILYKHLKTVLKQNLSSAFQTIQLHSVAVRYMEYSAVDLHTVFVDLVKKLLPALVWPVCFHLFFIQKRVYTYLRGSFSFKQSSSRKLTESLSDN